MRIDTENFIFFPAFRDKIRHLPLSSMVIIAIASVVFTALALLKLYSKWNNHKVTPPPTELPPKAPTKREIQVAFDNKLDEILDSERDLSPEDLTILANEVPYSLAGIINTGLTAILQKYAFPENANNVTMERRQKINLLLQKLTVLAKDNELARKALTNPNNPNKTFTPAGTPFPQNTPLMLLIKMNELNGVNTILKTLDKADLLKITPRGNIALNIALMTGQLQIVFLIIQRAEELDCLNDLLTFKNRVGYSSDDFLKALFDTLNTDSFIQISNKYFGGGEIDQTFTLYQLGRSHEGPRMLAIKHRLERNWNIIVNRQGNDSQNKFDRNQKLIDLWNIVKNKK